jgi:uncharacterized RDD family membrane protein YckC
VAAPETKRGGERQSLVKRAARGASERVLDLVDPDIVLEYVDINALLARIDVNALLERIEMNELLDRVDIDALLQRADIDALLDQVDLAAAVERAGIPQIVAESTTHLGGAALDLFRRPVVGLDEIISRVLNGLVRRDFSKFPAGPGDLTSWADDRAEEERTKTGRYAGPLTRLLAVAADTVVVAVGFTLIMAGLAFLIGLFVEGDYEFPANQGLWFGVALGFWAFVYLWFSVAVFGKTFGKAILGVRVVGSDGTITLGARQAFVRTLTFPISFALFGVGLLGIMFGHERRAWHDHFAGSAVVYDWGSRTAQMPTPLAEFLERRGGDPDEEEE